VLQPRRVLIVDDRRAVRQGLQALLALWPDVACVGEATDGQGGVKLVAEQRPDAIVMDIRMPGMDGLEATRRIKSQWPEVRVIVLTVRAEYEDEALAAGADAFLVKGGPPEALREAICNTSTRGDGGGGGRSQGVAARLRGDVVGCGWSTRFYCPRKDTGRAAGNIPGMLPWCAGIPSGKGLPWATPGRTGNL
jgi:DNA-binding NarL/FixJ family response regulator